MSTPSEILELQSGAQWLKADLHTHTPASEDMDEKWSNSTAEDLVEIAIEKGLDVIAITDHNTAAWCDDVRAAASGTSLTVLPGVEISTHQGHILALFDCDVPASRIEDLLVTVGIPRNDFGRLDVATAQGIAEVADEIAKAKGVAIAAHIDASRGFMRMINSGPERKRAYAAPNLWAIEILDAALKDDYQSGNKPGYSRRMPCIQSSDSWAAGADHHQLDGMSYRYSLLKMDERSLSGLKLALIDADIRVRLSGDKDTVPSSAILGMWVSGGFLSGQKLRFSDNVNCLIGDTGSGKSVAIELIRFALNQQTSVGKIRQEVNSLLKWQLGNTGTVHVLIYKGGSHYLVERTWGEVIELPLVRRMSDAGLLPVDNVDLSLLFPVKGFSQSEIIEFAREPEARLSLTDDLIDCSIEEATIASLKTDLRRNASNILTEHSKRDDILHQLKAKTSLLETLVNIDAILKDPRILQQQQWYQEEHILNAIWSQVSILKKDIISGMPLLSVEPPWTNDFESLPNQDLLILIKKTLDGLSEHVAKVRDDLISEVSISLEDLKRLHMQWKQRFAEAEKRYRKLLEEIDKDGIGLQALSEQRKQVSEKIKTLDILNNDLDNEVRPRLCALEQEREELLSSLQSNRRAITKKRELKARELTRTLRGRVRLKVHGRANSGRFSQAVLDVAQGSYLHKDDIFRLADKSHPVPFVKNLLAERFDDLASATEMERSKFERLHATVVERKRLQQLYETQLTDVDDVIDVDLRLGTGEFRPLEKLSHGQKCMVVLMVALAEGDFPLLVDQPEDALHAPGIEDGIVSILRSDRGVRQCLFATRNANILVSADAEQIIALKADADQGEVAGTGSLDRFDHRQLIIYHVEGGAEAFERRKTMYTLSPPAAPSV